MSMPTRSKLDQVQSALLLKLLSSAVVSKESTDVWVSCGNLALSLESLGEYRDDIFNGNAPLLRYTFSGRINEEMPWVKLEGGSSCTRIDAGEHWLVRLSCACRIFMQAAMVPSDPFTWMEEDMVKGWVKLSSVMVGRLSQMDAKGPEFDHVRAQAALDDMEHATAPVANPGVRTPRL